MEGHGEKGRSNEPNDSKSCHWIGRSETTKTQNIPTITKNKQRNFEYLQNLIKIYQFFLSGCCMAQRRSLSVLSAKTKWMSQIHWKSFSTKATNLNEQWNKITNSRRVQGGGCQSCGWSVSQRSIKGQQVKVENTDFVFFWCQLLGYVSRAVRPSVSYKHEKDIPISWKSTVENTDVDFRGVDSACMFWREATKFPWRSKTGIVICICVFFKSPNFPNWKMPCAQRTWLQLDGYPWILLQRHPTNATKSVSPSKSNLTDLRYWKDIWDHVSLFLFRLCAACMSFSVSRIGEKTDFPTFQLNCKNIHQIKQQCRQTN